MVAPSAPPSTFDPSAALEAARQAAQREVFRLLASPDDLSRLDAIRADAEKRRAAAESALSGALGAQVAEAVVGRAQVDGAQTALTELTARLAEIHALCTSSSAALGPADDAVRQLAVVRANFGATLGRVTTILDLPEEAAATLAELAAESELVVVFEELVALDARCAAAQALFEAEAERATHSQKGRAASAEHRERVASYFAKVEAARRAFETRLWAQLRHALHQGEAGSAAAVKVLRVVHEQDALDAALALQPVPPGGRAPIPRRYKAAALAAVEQAVDQRCARLLPEALAQLLRQPEESDVAELPLAELLGEVQECYQGLEDVYDFLVPCFPPDYGVWEVVLRRYHARLTFFYDRLGAFAEAPLSNRDILDVLRCHEGYLSLLRDLGVDPGWTVVTAMPFQLPPPEADHGSKTGRAMAAVEKESRARAKTAARAAGGNWEGSGPMPVDATARALLTGIALDTAGAFASGTLGVVKAAGVLVSQTKGLFGPTEAAAPRDEEAPAPREVPSAGLWGPGSGHGLSQLMDLYVKRMRAATATWMGNMVAADLAMPPSQAEGGRLFTPAGVDFFRIVNDQVEAVAAATRGELLLRCVVAVSALMLDFQRLQSAALERPAAELSLEVLCAYVNNSERCFELACEMLDSLREAAPDGDQAARLDVLEVPNQGFLDNATASLRKAVDSVFADPGFAAVFSALFADPSWWAGSACDTLCATVVDYFADLQVWLTEAFFRRAAEAVMERAVAQYCAALFLQCAAIRTDTMARLAADEEALRATFAPFCRDAALSTAFQTLADLRELACASTEGEIQAAFGTMLTHTPGTTVDVVERILAMRDDIPKSVKKQVVAACTEQWHARNGTVAGGLAAAAAALGGATAATAAAIQDAIKHAAGRSWFSRGK